MPCCFSSVFCVPNPPLTSHPALKQDTGLLHAELVLDWYVAGGVPSTPEQPNPWYIQGGCASTIVTLLSSATQGGKLSVQSIHALAKAIVAALDNPNSQLSKCSPDIPAILLAVTSTYCPGLGFLVAPNGTHVQCEPELVSSLVGSGRRVVAVSNHGYLRVRLYISQLSQPPLLLALTSDQ